MLSFIMIHISQTIYLKVNKMKLSFINFYTTIRLELSFRIYLKRDKTFFLYGKWLDTTAICAAARTRNIIGWRGPGDRKYPRTPRLVHARGQINAPHEYEFSVDPLFIEYITV